MLHLLLFFSRGHYDQVGDCMCHLLVAQIGVEELVIILGRMVCDKCEKKLGRIVTPDTWKSGARNTVESGGRKINENKAITSARERFNPISKSFPPCRICRQKVHQAGNHYCQACAYKKGICSMCGKKMIDVKNYRQSAA